MSRRRIDVPITKVVDLLKAGKNAKEIASDLNCHVSTVHRRANSGGFRFKRSKNQPTNIIHKKRTPRKYVQSNRVCTCCGIRFVPNKPIKGVKLTRLCAICWQFGEMGRAI